MAFRLQLPLTILLLTVAPIELSLGALRLDGLPVGCDNVSKLIEEKSALLPNCKYLPEENNSNTNLNRFCPVAYSWKQNLTDGHPHERLSASCVCQKKRGKGQGLPESPPCWQHRMPVTELRWLPQKPGAPTRLVEALELWPVDCATLYYAKQRSRDSLKPLTGKDLREAARKVGQPIFGQVSCGDGQPVSRPSFGMRMDKEVMPPLRPVARCLCSGQQPVMLPLPVMRIVNSSNATLLKPDLETVGVGCAVLR